MNYSEIVKNLVSKKYFPCLKFPDYGDRGHMFRELESRSEGNPTATVTCEQPREQHVKRPIANLSACQSTPLVDPRRARNAVPVPEP